MNSRFVGSYDCLIFGNQNANTNGVTNFNGGIRHKF